jgi:multidrug efflux pump
MNVSAVFIRRPVATTLLTVGITLVGAIAFNVLPVSPLPQVDFPTISVSAGLPGASPEIMASSIATPLERQFGHIAGITEMTSSSSLGSTNVTLQFDLSRNIDGAARDVEAAINAARTYLPADLPGNPSYRKVNPADSPIMILGLTSNKYDKPALYDYASSIIAQKLSQLQGVGQVSVGGGAGPSVRVEVNPTQLNSYGLTLSSVQAMLSQQNAHEATGQVYDGDQTLDIITNDQMHQADEYKPLVIGYHIGGSPVGRGRCVERRTECARSGLSGWRSFHHHHCLPPARRQHHRDQRPYQGGAAFHSGVHSTGHQAHHGS